MCLSLEHQNPSKTSEKMGYFVRVTVSLVVSFTAGSKVRVTFHRSRVQVIAPSINYQTTQIPLDLIEHFVKRLGLGDSFNAVHLPSIASTRQRTRSKHVFT